MFKEEIAEREKFISENRIHSHSTLGRSLTVTSIASPLFSSYAINAYGVGSREKMKMAFNTGIYEQYTFLGGSMFGDRYAKIFKAKPGTKKIFGDKYTMNYINDTYMTTNKGFSKLKDGTEIIEKGLGISRNYSDLFNHLKDLGFEKSNIYKKGTIFEGSKEQVTKKLTKFFSNLSPEDLAKVKSNFKKAGIKIGNNDIMQIIGKSGKVVNENVPANIANAFYDKFLKKSLSEKMASNSYIRTAFGVASSPIGNIVNVAGMFFGIMSTTHQDSASQSIANASNFTQIKGENTLNETGEQAIGTTLNSSQVNATNYHYILNSRNTAEGLRRNIDDIDIDTTKAKSENFTIY